MAKIDRGLNSKGFYLLVHFKSTFHFHQSTCC